MGDAMCWACPGAQWWTKQTQSFPRRWWPVQGDMHWGRRCLSSRRELAGRVWGVRELAMAHVDSRGSGHKALSALTLGRHLQNEQERARSELGRALQAEGTGSLLALGSRPGRWLHQGPSDAHIAVTNGSECNSSVSFTHCIIPIVNYLHWYQLIEKGD